MKIDLDNIWKWLGFAQKVKAKALLENYFVIDKDYKNGFPKRESKQMALIEVITKK